MAALVALGVGCSQTSGPSRVADVAAYSTQYQTGTQGLVAAGVYADFYDRRADCTQSSAGVCNVAVCPLQRPAPPPAPAAGTLTFGGLRDPLVLESPYLYDPPPAQRTLFGPGASLTLKGSGGADLPAFSASVVGGPSVKLNAPAIDGVSPVVVSRAQALALAWEPAKSGEVVGHLEQGTADRHIEVECRFSASAGSGSIVVTPFTAGPGTLDVRGESRTYVEAGDWGVTFRAFTNALTPAGDHVRVSVDLQ